MAPPHRQRQRHLYTRISRLPLWAGLLSAFGAYALLRPLALLPMSAPQETVGIASTAIAQLLAPLARAGQYLIPLGLLIVTAISAFVRWKRRDLRNLVTRDASGTLLRGIPHRNFEVLVAEVFRDLGYRVTQAEQLPGSPCDLELDKNGKFYLVHYGSWKSSRLDVHIVRDLVAEIDASGADGGYIVSSGHYTPDAKRVAEGNGIVLIDGRRLKELIRLEDHSVPREPVLGMETFTSAVRRLKSLADAGLERATALAASARTPNKGRAPAAPEEYRRSAPRSAVPDSEEETPEATLGRKLTALLRSDDDAFLSDHDVQPPPAPRTLPPVMQRTRWRFRPRLKKVADVVGITATAVVIWAGYQWFQSLPGQPAHSPWDLLGTGSAETTPYLIQNRFGRDATAGIPPDSGTKERPLGQLNYGGEWEKRTTSADRWTRVRLPVPEEAPTEEYHGIRELEAAFNRKYVPPPDCYQWETTADMARCGNHRMRARNAFIESRGRITPEMLGIDGTHSGYPQPVDPSSDWRQEQAEWQDGSNGQLYAPSWQEPPSGDGNWGNAASPDPDGDQPRSSRDDWYGYGSQDPMKSMRGDWRTEGAWDQSRTWAEEQEWRQGSVPDDNRRQAPDWRRQEYADHPGGWLQEQDGRQRVAPNQDGGWREDRP